MGHPRLRLVSNSTIELHRCRSIWTGLAFSPRLTNILTYRTHVVDPKYTNNLPQRGRLKTKSSCKHQLGQVLFLCEIDHQAHTVCRYISQEALLKDGGAERPRSADWYPGGWPSLAGSLIANDGGRRGLRLARQAPAATDASGPADGLGRGQAQRALAFSQIDWPSFSEIDWEKYRPFFRLEGTVGKCPVGAHRTKCRKRFCHWGLCYNRGCHIGHYCKGTSNADNF